MKKLILAGLLLCPVLAPAKTMFVMHGGAGTITRQNMTAEAEAQIRAKLEEALKAGHAILARGGSSVDAVEVSIRILEDSPLFNAGKGAVFTHEGRNELDSAIMDGKSDLMKETQSDHKGTVGAVALDQAGNLAAGTSTGGTTNKQFGRVGDTPIIGAGTYASNDSVAVSCTGTGEFFIRWTVAHDIAALVQYKGMTVGQAGNEVIHRKLEAVKGDGGAIVLDRKGNFAMPFNTEGMYRGWIGDDGVPHVLIYKD